MNLPFDLDVEEIHSRIETGVCELTGIPFDLVTPKAWNSPSLDQIKPAAGYTKDNVRVVLYSVNVMNHNWGPKYILEVADAIREQHKKKSNDLSERLAENLKKRLLSGSMEYKMTWKKLTTPSGLVLWQHQASAHRTSDSDSTGWPTPCAADNRDRGSWDDPAIQRRKRIGKSIELSMLVGVAADQAHLTGWPTPKASEAEKDSRTPEGAYREVMRNKGPSVSAVAQLAGWPTPNCADVNASRSNDPQAYSRRWMNRENHGSQLAHTAQALIDQPDQTTTGATAPSSPAETEKPAASQPKLSLNPFFSMWLMGFPVAWTLAGISSALPKVSPSPKPSQPE
jgi:hypothetical protein